MFGNLNKTPFGNTAPNTSFGFGGAPASTANPFGQSQNLFGKPAAGVFGSPSTSTFGQPAATSLFPSTQPQQTNLFQNANTTFGTVPTTQSGFGSNLFGQQQQPAAGGLFNTSSTFGQQNKPAAFGFGTTPNQPTLFGQQPQQQTNVFQSTGSTLFGGTSSFGAQQSGTVVKFNPVTGTDTMMKNGVSQNINTKHHSITCMKEYENKSFEELRFEDYQANRKGPQQQTGFGTAPFGATPASTSSLFGQTDANKPAFGQTTGFGATTSTFGQNTTGFGMGAQNTTGGLFGAKPTAFGAPTSSAGSTFGFGTTPPTVNPFGATQQTKPFGSPAQSFMGAATMQPSSGFGTGLFGQTNTQTTATSLFGKPAQPTTGFGQTGQTTAFSFNPPASTQSSNLFGNTNKSLFGQTSTAPGFGMTNTLGTGQQGFGNTFGKPATTGFGTQPQTGFGTTLGGLQNQNTGLFGNTQNKPTGLFGNTGSTGLFGNTSMYSMGSNSFGLGQPQQQQQSLFPQPEQNQPTNISLLTSDPFGDCPHLSGLEPKLKSNETNAMTATDPKELKSLLDASKKVDVSQNAKLKVVPWKSIKDSLFEGLPKQNGAGSTDKEANSYVKSNVRRLVLKSKPSGDDSGSSNRMRSNILDILDSEDKENKDKAKTIENRANNILNLEAKTNPIKLNFDGSITNEIEVESIQSPQFNLHAVQNASTPAKDATIAIRSNTPLSLDIEEEPLIRGSGDANNVTKKHPTGIVCTRPEYYTLPCVDALTQYVDENGACLVKGFTIGRKGYGNVYFPDEMDVSGLNVDELVHFRYREINVYPDESKKPPVGRGLNRKAQVTLDNVYPRKSGSNALIKDVGELLHMNFAEKLRKVTEKKGAKFVDYRPETGSWVFKVEHFSRYGFNDSDEEGSDQNGNNEKLKRQQKEREAGKVDGPNGAQKKKEEGAALAQQKKDEPAKEVDSQKLALEHDIFIDEDQSSEEDMLHHSMYVDNASEDNYYQIPTPGMPMDAFDTFKATKNIQVMKSTLFAEDDRSSDGAGSHISILKQYLDLHDEILPRLPVVEEEMPLRKRGVIRPNVYKVYNYGGSEIPPNILPSKCYSDMAMFKGRSFKVSFAKGFDFYTLHSNRGEITDEIALKTFEVQKNIDPLKEILDAALRIVLDESTCSIASRDVPTFKIVNGPSYLKKQSKLFERLTNECVCDESNYMHSVWTLCDALWGPSEESVHNRRYLLSEWLKVNALSDDLPLKTQQFYSVEETVRSIFAHLSVFKIFEAANVSMENRMPSLSMLISQLSLKNFTKALMREQIEAWYESSAAKHVSDDLKKVYLLLSGVCTKEEVNVFENVDWKRAFGMHLWYVCPNGAPVETAIESYRESFEEIGYAEAPRPPYGGNGAFDIIYHVLWLYKSAIHRLSSVLNPATHTNDPLDYRLSWLLLQLFLSLNVGLIESFELNKITTSFSNQLESLGMFEWAIFVLLYLNDDRLKKKLIMRILDRNLSMECDREAIATQNNLVNNMEIPAEWIHLVKGEKLALAERYYEAFNHFAHAKEYVKANEILIGRLLPTLFINEQYEVLQSFIVAIKPGSKDILYWDNQAGLFEEFLELQERVVSFSDREMFKLQMELQLMSARVKHFPLDTDEQKLCVAELSKRCASLYKELCVKSDTKVFKDSYVQLMENLVMPPDYSHLEALYLIHEEI